MDLGSEFYFELKLKKSNAPEVLEIKPTTALSNKTVLLAEDNLVNAMVAIKLLSKWKIETVHAKNGMDAYEKSLQQQFDFILMDIHMPEMDGFEATRQIRKEENPNFKTPIFALTADITAMHKEDYVNYFNDFLHKPIEIEKLHEALLNAVLQ